MVGIKKIIFLFIFLCFCVKLDAGLAEQQQPYAFEEIITETVHGVIVPKERAREFYYGNKINGYFTPLREDVLKAEAGVVDYIDDHTPQVKGYPFVPDLDQKLANYKRQYAGAVMSGKRKIWMNFFCRTINDGWKRKLFKVFGGGACYFNVLYDIDSGTFSELWINGLGIRTVPDSNENEGQKEPGSHVEESQEKTDISHSK